MDYRYFTSFATILINLNITLYTVYNCNMSIYKIPGPPNSLFNSGPSHVSMKKFWVVREFEKTN